MPRSRSDAPERQSDPGPATLRHETRRAAAAPPRRSVRSYVPQLCAKPFTGARKPRFHRANGDPERESDFFVAQAIDLAQHDGRFLIEREAVERHTDPLRELLLPHQPIRSAAHRLRQVAMILNVLIERDLLRAMAPPPPALTVAGLIDDDAIDPGAEAGVAAERLNG